MTVTTLCVLLAALVGNAAGELAPPDKSYHILMLLPLSSKSHRNVFMSLAEALADRGHKIVMLTNHPKSSEHPNVHEVQHDLLCLKEEEHNMFEVRSMGTMRGFLLLAETLPAVAREMYQVPVVKELYEKRKEFDLIVVSHRFNEVAYPFVHEIPFITVVPPGMNPHQSAVLGNVLNPAYVVNFLLDFPSPMSTWHRFLNMLMHIVLPLYWNNWIIVPLIQKEISSQFPDLPPLLELERNMSLALLNSHFSISTTLPLLPSQVEVGAMHCRPANHLPQELESWITGAGPEGVIYFSLGSFTRGNSMPVQYRDLFVQAFRRLPQRVIWKYEGELEGLSDNVMFSKWLPQQDILGMSVPLYMRWPGAGTSALTWGWISLHGVGELTEIQGRFTADQYLEILEEVILPSVRNYALPHPKKIIFLQDNCTLHKARIVTRWFNEQRNLDLLDWPSKACDMIPNENIWANMVKV